MSAIEICILKAIMNALPVAAKEGQGNTALAINITSKGIYLYCALLIYKTSYKVGLSFMWGSIKRRLVYSVMATTAA